MKEYLIRISKPAEQDTLNAVEYIDSILHNPSASNSLLDAIEEGFSSITFFPKKCALVKDPILASYCISLLIIKNHLALYTVDEVSNIIHIVRFLYGKSSLQSILKNDISI